MVEFPSFRDPFELPSLPSTRMHVSDVRFFAMHPERRYRCRRPFRSELEALAGQLSPLKPGQERVAIINRLTEREPHQFFAGLYTVRGEDGQPPRLPRSDSEISKAFAARRRRPERTATHG